jgi:hypothetical protein
MRDATTKNSDAYSIKFERPCRRVRVLLAASRRRPSARVQPDPGTASIVCRHFGGGGGGIVTQPQ